MKPTPHLSVDVLSALHDGALSPTDAALAQDHLKTCDSCREALRELAAVDEALRDEPLEMSENDWEALAGRVEDAIRREGAPADTARNPGAIPHTQDPSDASRSASNRRHERRVPEPGLWDWLFPRRLAFGAAGTLFAVILVFLLRPQASRFTPPSERDEGVLEGQLEAETSSPVDSVAETATTTKIEPEADESKGAAPEDLVTDQPTEPPPTHSAPRAQGEASPKSELNSNGEEPTSSDIDPLKAPLNEEGASREHDREPLQVPVPRPETPPEIVDMRHKPSGTLSVVALSGPPESTLLRELAALDEYRNVHLGLRAKVKAFEPPTPPTEVDRASDVGSSHGRGLPMEKGVPAEAGSTSLDREVFLVEALVRLNPAKYCAEVMSRAPRWTADSARVSLSDSAAAIVDILTRETCRPLPR